MIYSRLLERRLERVGVFVLVEVYGGRWAVFGPWGYEGTRATEVEARRLAAEAAAR